MCDPDGDGFLQRVGLARTATTVLQRSKGANPTGGHQHSPLHSGANEQASECEHAPGVHSGEWPRTCNGCSSPPTRRDQRSR